MDEPELRESIQRSGPVLPVVFWDGQAIDGRKRQRICAELARAIDERHCVTLRDACSYLWAVGHPERALELAATREIKELVALCGARPAAIARFIRPRAKYLHKLPRHLRGQKLVRVQVWMEPQLLTIAKTAGAREGLNLSAFIREATYDRAQLVDARAPLPGTTRAPRWVKPREKRSRVR